MPFRALTPGPSPRVVYQRGRAPDLFRNEWGARAQPNPGGAATFAYETRLMEPLMILGASYHMRWHPSPIGSPPMMARPTVIPLGIARTAGQMDRTPLSQNLPA